MLILQFSAYNLCSRAYFNPKVYFIKQLSLSKTNIIIASVDNIQMF